MFEFRLADIPVRIEFWILVTALIIGPRDMRGAALWVPCVVLGVLAHELGHALAARYYGQRPRIAIHGLGGTTSFGGGPELSPGQRILITAAGPAVGITIGGAFFAARTFAPLAPVAQDLLFYLSIVNFGWGVLNLLPVLPLDGGQIVTTLAETVFGPRGRRVAHWVSLVFCLGLAGLAMAIQSWWNLFIVVLLALSNVQALRALAGVERAADGGEGHITPPESRERPDRG